MYRYRLYGLLVLICGVFSMTGCEAGPAQVGHEEPAQIIGVAKAKYDASFEVCAALLKEHRFMLDRQDRRFGVLTSKPQFSSTVLEPWGADKVGSGGLDSTLNMQKRVVRVSLNAVEGENGEKIEIPQGVVKIGGGVDYLLGVEVLVLQHQRPTRILNTAAVRETNFRSRHRELARTQLSERGVEGQFWREIGRDYAYERYLVGRIVREMMEHGG